MKKHILAAALAFAAAGAFAQHPHGLPPGIAKKLAACVDCGTVQDVHHEKRKGEGGAVGIVAGAAAGGLLGHQVGGGNGNTLATIGGAVAGGFLGNEVQKRVSSRQVWITRVKMRDGSVRSYEHEQAPPWKAGMVVRVGEDNRIVIID
jgi:outer membrane lipoprotein SlyB